jgi:hypothetical protein
LEDTKAMLLVDNDEPKSLGTQVVGEKRVSAHENIEVTFVCFREVLTPISG